jgi:hypothetical protein
VTYTAFVDAAGGSGGDSFTMAVAHREPNGVAVLDMIRERKPTFSPAEVVVEFCAEIARYGCTLPLPCALADKRRSGSTVRNLKVESP